MDTGSQLDIISSSVVQKLQGTTVVEESEYTKIVAVNQSETHILGAIQKTIEIAGLKVPAKFHILPESNHDVILGRKFIFDNIKSIDFEGAEVTFKRTEGVDPKARISCMRGEKKSPVQAAAKVA